MPTATPHPTLHTVGSFLPPLPLSALGPTLKRLMGRSPPSSNLSKVPPALLAPLFSPASALPFRTSYPLWQSRWVLIPSPRTTLSHSIILQAQPLSPNPAGWVTIPTMGTSYHSTYTRPSLTHLSPDQVAKLQGEMTTMYSPGPSQCLVHSSGAQKPFVE